MTRFLASDRALRLVWVPLPVALFLIIIWLRMPDWTYGTDGKLAVWVMEVCRVME